MLKHILVGTQDKTLHELCEQIQSTAPFYLFNEVNDLLDKIAALHEGLIVFVDVEWPNNQNGYNVARELKRRRDGSRTILLVDQIDDVKSQWSAKVNAEMVERTESAFLSKFVPFINTLGLQVPDTLQAYRLPSPSGQEKHASTLPLTQVEIELERILGPMGPLLLRDAMTVSNENLIIALKKVAAFGTTATERMQVENLIVQFGQR